MRLTTLDKHYMNMPTEDMEYEIGQLYSYFDKANNYFYNGELIRPVILPQTKGRKQLELGWVKEKNGWKKTSDLSGFYELNICPELFNGDMAGVIEILLHQMVHLYCMQNHIKDVSNEGHYHNKRFREIASSHGLSVQKSKTNGWSDTSLTQEAFDFFNCDRNYGFRIFHATPEPSAPKRTGGASRKYECPKCKRAVWGNKSTKVICGYCNCPMELKKPLEDHFNNGTSQPSHLDAELSEASKLFDEI